MADPTFSQMKPVMQNAVRSYGEKFGMSFDMKLPTRLSPVTPVAPRPIK
jgi:hypothetical protein